ncbi:hypothetical protein [Polynucleobacter necessarius]|uniref:hypothetical protein n=1 Tax=Polynucleobacter necessarius TaxID=576610 RepID=UPI0018D512B5|nr:hypothetical protein [Polynucleobacter necessarius]
MPLIFRSIIITLLLGFNLLQPAFAQFGNFFGDSKSVDEQRQEILTKNQATLKQRYEVQPKARELVERSAGYATFSNFGMKILIAGGGTGSGVVIDKASKKPIYQES